MILNSGLDQIMLRNLGALCNYIAVGTGSGAPTATQTGLVAEAARTNQTLGLVTKGVQRLAPGSYRLTFGVAFDYAEANGNLTELGGSHLSGSGTTNTRALFLENGNPTVITKTSSTRLLVNYYVDVTFPTAASAATINIAGLGDRTLTYMFTGRNEPTFGWGDLDLFLNAKEPAIGVNTAAMSMVYGDVGMPSSFYGGFQPYTTGTFKRITRGERPAEAADVTVYGYSAGYYLAGNSQTRSMIKAQFDNTFVKSKDYRLDLGFEVGIGRA